MTELGDALHRLFTPAGTSVPAGVWRWPLGVVADDYMEGDVDDCD